jgi:uncharacterized membrane protein YfcA
MSVEALVVFAVVVAAGSLFQGLLGFGSALIAAPLALVVVDKATAVPALGIAGLVLNALLLISIRGELRGRVLVSLVVSSLLGMPAGVLVLKQVPTGGLQVAAGALSIGFALLIARTSPQERTVPGATPVAGVLSGALSTSTSMGGPPVVLLLAHGGVERDQSRMTLAAFFLCSSLVSMAVFGAGGLLTPSALEFGAAALPGATVGGLVGHRISARVPQRHFRRIALVAVGITGLTAVVTGALALR